MGRDFVGTGILLVMNYKGTTLLEDIKRKMEKGCSEKEIDSPNAVRYRSIGQEQATGTGRNWTRSQPQGVIRELHVHIYLGTYLPSCQYHIPFMFSYLYM